MALGKITIVIGAGIIGSILSKEGRLSDATNFFSSALKIVTKSLQQDKEGSGSTTKPRTDALLAQVNSLRQELKLLATSRSVTVVTSTRSGSRAYGVTTVLVVGCLGYGYIWWKGWKLSDMMFVTRHSFSDACSAVGKQFELVSSSIASAKRHLSSKIDVVDNSLDEMKELNAAIKKEVTQIHGDACSVHIDVESVTHAFKNLEAKIEQLDNGQNFAGRGLYALCKSAEGWQQSMNMQSIQEPPSRLLQHSESSRSLGVTRESPSSLLRHSESSRSLGVTRTGSLPPLSLEPHSPTDSPSVLRPSISVSAAGLKELQKISNPIRSGNFRTSPKNASNSTHSVDEPSSSTSNTGRFAWKMPSFIGLNRTWSNAN